MIGGGPGHHGFRNASQPAANWSVSLSASSPPVTSLAWSQGTIVAASYQGPIYALNASTGVRLWTYSIPNHFGFDTAIVAGDYVLVGNVSTLTALDLATGQLVWDYTTPAYPNPRYTQEQYVNAPAVVGDRVIFGTTGPMAFAVGLQDGREVWNFTLPDQVEKNTNAPAVADGTTVLLGSSGFKGLVAVDARNGTLLWEYGRGDLFPVSIPTGIDGGIVVASANGFIHNILAFDVTNGTDLWETRLRGEVHHPPVVADGRVYLYATDNRLYAFDTATGEQAWRAELTQATGCFGRDWCIPDNPAPAIANGIVFLPGRDEVLYAIDAASGFILSRYPLPSGTRTTPIVVGDTLFVGYDSTVAAIPIQAVLST